MIVDNEKEKQYLLNNAVINVDETDYIDSNNTLKIPAGKTLALLSTIACQYFQLNIIQGENDITTLNRILFNDNTADDIEKFFVNETLELKGSLCYQEPQLTCGFIIHNTSSNEIICNILLLKNPPAIATEGGDTPTPTPSTTNTDNVNVSNSTEESLTGTATKQNIINNENKNRLQEVINDVSITTNQQGNRIQVKQYNSNTLLDKTFSISYDYTNNSEDKLKITNTDNVLFNSSNYTMSFGDKLVLQEKTQTITNKTINADNNNITDLEVDNFKNSAIAKSSDNIPTYNNASDTKLTTEKNIQKVLQNIQTPTNNNDAVNKQYVDNLITQTIEFKGYICIDDPVDEGAQVKNGEYWFLSETLDFPTNTTTLQVYKRENNQWSQLTTNIPLEILQLWRNMNSGTSGIYMGGGSWDKFNTNIAIDDKTIKTNNLGQLKVASIIKEYSLSDDVLPPTSEDQILFQSGDVICVNTGRDIKQLNFKYFQVVSSMGVFGLPNTLYYLDTEYYNSVNDTTYKVGLYIWDDSHNRYIEVANNSTEIDIATTIDNTSDNSKPAGAKAVYDFVLSNNINTYGLTLKRYTGVITVVSGTNSWKINITVGSGEKVISATPATEGTVAIVYINTNGIRQSGNVVSCNGWYSLSGNYQVGITIITIKGGDNVNIKGI